jgi:hypothetical protein
MYKRVAYGHKSFKNDYWVKEKGSPSNETRFDIVAYSPGSGVVVV